MLKKVVNVKNVVLLVIIIVLAVIIFKQQAVLNEKVNAFDDAKKATAEINQISDNQKLENDMAGSTSEEEDYARSEDYIYPGERVFDYQD